MAIGCKEHVYHGRQVTGCQLPVKRDGYCAVHHPDAITKRKASSEARWASILANHQEMERKMAAYDRFRKALEAIVNEFRAIHPGEWSMKRVRDIARKALAEEEK